MTNTDPLIRDSEGAAIMSCSKATWWRRVADGTIPPAIKIGGMSRWRLSDIEAVIARPKPTARCIKGPRKPGRVNGAWYFYSK